MHNCEERLRSKLTPLLQLVVFLIFCLPSSVNAQMLFVSDAGNNTISKISLSGTVTTFVSSGLNVPCGLVFNNSGTLYVADAGDNKILEVDASGSVSTFVNGSAGLNIPLGLAMDSSGNIYAANWGNDTVSKITSAGVVSTFATGLSSGVAGLAFDTSGNLYASTTGTVAIYKITPSGSVSTFVSGGLGYPPALAIDAGGNLYAPAIITSYPVSKIDSSGSVSTFATFSTRLGGDVFDNSGILYVVERSTGVIDAITPGGSVSILASLADGSNQLEYIAFTTAPEPSCWVLLVMGIILTPLLVLWKRRKRA